MVDVADLQAAQLGDGGAVQQGEQSDEGLVGLEFVGVSGPAAQQVTLPGQVQDGAVEGDVGVGA